jgi:hypothetical protein
MNCIEKSALTTRSTRSACTWWLAQAKGNRSNLASSSRAAQNDALQPQPTAFPESLSGLIERVTFHNEDTGFAVLKVKAKGHRDLVTVVGSLASPGSRP